MKMNKNVGVADLIIRVVMGVSLVIAGIIIVKGTAGLIFVALSIPLLASALLGLCPGCTLLGLSTKKENDCR